MHDCDDRDPKAVRKVSALSILGLLDESEPNGDDGYQSDPSTISDDAFLAYELALDLQCP